MAIIYMGPLERRRKYLENELKDGGNKMKKNSKRRRKHYQQHQCL